MDEEDRLDSGSSLQTATREESTWLALEQFLFIRWIVVDASLGSGVGVSSRMRRGARMLPSSRGGDLRWMAGVAAASAPPFGFLHGGGGEVKCGGASCVVRRASCVVRR
jgi:hypothetical protein